MIKRPYSIRQLPSGEWEARLRFGKGQRKRFVLKCCLTETAANKRAATMVEMAATLTTTGHAGDALAILSRAAAATDAQTMADLRGVVRRLSRGEFESTQEDPSIVGKPRNFREVAEEWMDGDLHRQFPDRVRAIDHTNNRFQAEAYVFPIIGQVPVTELTRAKCSVVMQKLPVRLSPSSRRHVAQIIARVLHLAELAGYLERSPLPKLWLPARSKKKAVPVLYPSEDLLLLACDKVPLARRVYYGFLHREGGRRVETADLCWYEFDLVNRTVQSDRNKTGNGRFWKLGEGVAEALAAWFELRGKPDLDTLVFCNLDGSPLDIDRMAETIRDDLALAGIKRQALFRKGENSLRFGTHAFRHSFTTRSLANGKTDDWVRQRTGHKSNELMTYREAASSLLELELGEVERLVNVIPELARVHAKLAATTRRPPSSSNDTEAGPKPGPAVAQVDHVIEANSAEREGFEPSVQLPVHMISSHAPSASRSPLQVWCIRTGPHELARFRAKQWLSR